MRRWTIETSNPDRLALAEAAGVIRDGGLVVFPTDTLYGVAADPRNPQAVAAVYRVKGRDAAEPLPLVAADFEQVEQVTGGLTPLARRLASAFWPGPLTLVVAASPLLVAEVHGGTGTVAVRVPDHRVARDLAAAAGFPITSTSANRSGEAPSRSADAAVAGLADEVDGVLDAGLTPGGPPSTIVDARGDRPRLLRPGAIAYDRVLAVLEGS